LKFEAHWLRDKLEGGIRLQPAILPGKNVGSEKARRRKGAWWMIVQAEWVLILKERMMTGGPFA
jgi:hypothetical protein